jgi:hypothetical protein
VIPVDLTPSSTYVQGVIIDGDSDVKPPGRRRSAAVTGTSH